MTSIWNIATLMAAIPTLAPVPPAVAPAAPARSEPQACGTVNVFYTGLPPYHPATVGQGYDPLQVDIGLKNETLNLLKAGYNVHVVWSGPETPVPVLENRIAQTGVSFDVTAIGFGVRGATQEPIVERFEDLVDMMYRNLPHARKVYNYSPNSLVWSVTHRVPMAEDCEAVEKWGKLLGYEEICDSRCDKMKQQYEARRLNVQL